MIGIGRTRSSQRRRVGGEGGEWRGTMDGNEDGGTMSRPRHNPFRAQKSRQTALLDRHRPSGMLFSMGGGGAGRMGMLGEEEDEGRWEFWWRENVEEMSEYCTKNNSASSICPFSTINSNNNSKMRW